MEYRPYEAESIFCNELKLINDEKIRHFTIDMLNECHQDNFIRPASATGKYHPSFSQGNGGLVRHTKALVKMLTVFQSARPDLNWDEIYAAAILHDMHKYDGGKYTVKEHAELMSNIILHHVDEYDVYMKMHIAQLVKYHMGRFDVPNFNEYDENDGGVFNISAFMDESAWILHYADMIVSRKWYGTKDVYVNSTDN